jgi:hypothetical protein
MRTRPRSPIAILAVPLSVAFSTALVRPAQAQDATPQCIASSEQGLDLRKQEKLLDARKVLAACATTKCPDEIRTTCEQRISEINGVLPSIVFEVKDAKGNDVPNVQLTVDGMVAAGQLGGRSTPMDPGAHVFSFAAPGQPPVEKRLVIREGERDRHERVVLGVPDVPVPATPAPPPAPESTVTVTPVAPPPAAPPPEAPSGASPGGTQRAVGLAVGGVGVAGVVIGAVFGLVASSKWSSAKTDCGGGCGPNSVAQSEKSDASSAATISTVGFVAGAVLLAGGVAVFFTAPSASHSSTATASASSALRLVPAPSPGGGALLLQGGF